MDDAAWAVLAAGLRSRSPFTRAQAGAELRRRVHQQRQAAVDDRAETLLVDLLDSDDATVRAAAAYALSVGTDDRSVAALRDRLTDSSPAVRTEAVDALVARSFDHDFPRRPGAFPAGSLTPLGAGTDPAMDRIRETLPAIRERLADDDPTVRLAALRYLGRAFRLGVLDATDAVAAARSRLDDADPAVRHAALDLCARCWADGSLSAATLAELVVELLDDTAPEVRERALDLADQLSAADPAVVETLAPAVLDRLEDDRRDHRADALGLVRQLWADGHVTSEQVAPAVAERVRADSDPDIRADAARLLGELDPPDVVEQLAAALHDPAGDVRWRAGQALRERRHCWADAAVIEGAVAAARAPGETDTDVVAILRGTADDRTVPGLLALTRGPSGSKRGTAVRALAGVPAAHVTERLVECTSDPHRQVRADALRGLAGRRDERLPDLLVDGLDDEDPKVRRAAAEALSRYTDRESVRQRLAALVEDDTEEKPVRRAAVDAHPDYSRGDTDSLANRVVGQALVALIYPFLALFVVAVTWRGDGRQEGFAATRDMFLDWYPLAYLLGHAGYWLLALVLLGVVRP